LIKIFSFFILTYILFEHLNLFLFFRIPFATTPTSKFKPFAGPSSPAGRLRQGHPPALRTEAARRVGPGGRVDNRVGGLFAFF
jgi:hypothetical protein